MKKLKILYVDGNVDSRSNHGGAVEGMRLLIKDLSTDEFESTACGSFPSMRTQTYSRERKCMNEIEGCHYVLLSNDIIIS